VSPLAVPVVALFWLLAFVHLLFPGTMSRLGVRWHARMNGPDPNAKHLMGPPQMRKAGLFLVALATIVTALALKGIIR
jgi:hypothetical protein